MPIPREVNRPYLTRDEKFVLYNPEIKDCEQEQRAAHDFFYAPGQKVSDCIMTSRYYTKKIYPHVDPNIIDKTLSLGSVEEGYEQYGSWHLGSKILNEGGKEIWYLDSASSQVTAEELMSKLTAGDIFLWGYPNEEENLHTRGANAKEDIGNIRVDRKVAHTSVYNGGNSDSEMIVGHGYGGRAGQEVVIAEEKDGKTVYHLESVREELIGIYRDPKLAKAISRPAEDRFKKEISLPFKPFAAPLVTNANLFIKNYAYARQRIAHRLRVPLSIDDKLAERALAIGVEESGFYGEAVGKGGSPLKKIAAEIPVPNLGEAYEAASKTAAVGPGGVIGLAAPVAAFFGTAISSTESLWEKYLEVKEDKEYNRTAKKISDIYTKSTDPLKNIRAQSDIDNNQDVYFQMGVQTMNERYDYLKKNGVNPFTQRWKREKLAVQVLKENGMDYRNKELVNKVGRGITASHEVLIDPTLYGQNTKPSFGAYRFKNVKAKELENIKYLFGSSEMAYHSTDLMKILKDHEDPRAVAVGGMLAVYRMAQSAKTVINMYGTQLSDDDIIDIASTSHSQASALEPEYIDFFYKDRAKDYLGISKVEKLKKNQEDYVRTNLNEEQAKALIPGWMSKKDIADRNAIDKEVRMNILNEQIMEEEAYGTGQSNIY